MALSRSRRLTLRAESRPSQHDASRAAFEILSHFGLVGYFPSGLHHNKKMPKGGKNNGAKLKTANYIPNY
jgi:hypothetical protein